MASVLPWQSKSAHLSTRGPHKEQWTPPAVGASESAGEMNGSLEKKISSGSENSKTPIGEQKIQAFPFWQPVLES